MHILVTGGAGYIGSILVPQLLQQGHNVRVLDGLSRSGQSLLCVWSHPGFDFQLGDVRRRDHLRHAVEGMNAVVHLAAVVGNEACERHPEIAWEVNVNGSLALLEEAQRAGVERFIFASTCSNYGRMKDPLRYLDEESEVNPASVYTETMVAVERLMLQTGAGNMCRTPLRLATVFGVSPRMRFDLTVNQFTLSLLTVGRLVLYEGPYSRPYVHVGDVARAIRLVLESAPGKVNRRIFNVGDTTQNFQDDQLVELIRPYVESFTIETTGPAPHAWDSRVSFSRIREELGFRIKRTVPDGIAEVARLVRANVIKDYSAPELRN